MLMPMVAMARVRTSSRVRSAARAMTAAAMAPLPWITRPTMTPSMLLASAATTLPRANRARPAKITGLRPMRSESMPKGMPSIAWVRP